MVSGSTALTVALVPTGMKAGVRMSPCGVWITPTRPDRPGSSASTSKNSPDRALTAVHSHTMRVVPTVAALTARPVAHASVNSGTTSSPCSLGTLFLTAPVQRTGSA